MRNMKKTIPALLLALGLALSITACGNKESKTVTPDNSTTPGAILRGGAIFRGNSFRLFVSASCYTQCHTEC